MWFEFVALAFACYCISKPVSERTRTSCTAFLAIITAISMTQTTASFAELCVPPLPAGASEHARALRCPRAGHHRASGHPASCRC